MAHEPDEIDDFFSDKAAASRETSYHRCLKLLENDEDIKGLFKFNSFLNSVEFSKQPFWHKENKIDCEIIDNDLIQLLTLITKKYNFSPTDQNLIKAITYESMKLSYHPIKNYLNFLTWDGVHRLDEWLIKISGCDDNLYTRAVSRKMLCAAVARVYDPGCQFDYFPILEGEQRIRKSTLVRTLAGKKWFTTLSFHYNDQQIIEIMRGKWIIEVDEMRGFNKQEDTRIKSLLSRLTDRMRLSYGRFAQDFPRQSIMIGTMNPDGDNQYLSDQTGNTRYWPIQCKGKINIDLLEELRDQLFAEAVVRYKNKEALWLEQEEVENMAIIEQSNRQIDDPIDEIITKWLFNRMKEFEPKTTVSEILDKCLNIQSANMNRSVSTRVGRILIRLGWVLRRELVDGKQIRSYYPPGTKDPALTNVKKDNDIDWGE